MCHTWIGILFQGCDNFESVTNRTHGKLEMLAMHMAWTRGVVGVQSVIVGTFKALDTW